MQISKEKRKEYNENFSKKHKNDKFKCDVCDREYSIFNKSHHLNSNKHILNSIKKDKIEDLEQLKKILK
jgi:collagenase-like PrtC family protease